MDRNKNATLEKIKPHCDTFYKAFSMHDTSITILLLQYTYIHSLLFCIILGIYRTLGTVCFIILQTPYTRIANKHITKCLHLVKSLQPCYSHHLKTNEIIMKEGFQDPTTNRLFGKGPILDLYDKNWIKISKIGRDYEII